ncbi:BSD-domain protein, putative [Plasmodium ovale curtisi]|uniref:BSD-domain protein, putative n=1 Tax=Plasmodium ovale curtisi TaxID=864141 RepID=A0A1A8VPR5_PLAOA|nr:BSD-domain protein, putative [Plasmodium ovale curtisi]
MMGNKHNRRKKYELCEVQYEKEFELKYPWNEIIKWGGNDLNVDISIMTIQRIIEEIKDITIDEENFFNVTEGKSIDSFHFDKDFVLWATSLLKEIKNLKKFTMARRKNGKVPGFHFLCTDSVDAYAENKIKIDIETDANIGAKIDVRINVTTEIEGLEKIEDEEEKSPETFG